MNFGDSPQFGQELLELRPETEKCKFSLKCHPWSLTVNSLPAALEVETGLTLGAHHQVLVVTDQTGAEMTTGDGVGRWWEAVLRTVSRTVG